MEHVDRAVEELKPPLKWAGGKRWLVPHLQPYWIPHSSKRLVEPFCGGLAVSLALKPDYALLNDVNPHLVNFFRWFQRGLVIDLRMENSSDLYYEYQNRFNKIIRSGQEWSKEAAELLYYLNRTGYNGLCRFNHKGEFNVPFGRYSTINYESDFTSYKRVLSKWEVICGDFEKVPVETDDFIHADPPYDVNFTQYSHNSFRWEDQVRLAEWLVRHRGPVILSNQVTKRIVDLYTRLGFRLRYFEASRMIRSKALEVLALRQL